MLRTCALLLGLLCVGGCQTVKPYERVYLNDEDMLLQQRPSAFNEINAANYREGAAGAIGGKIRWRMRLQLILISFLGIWPCFGQSPDSTHKVTGDIEIDFLMSYYDQDGNHSAVSGGLGSESLQDYVSTLVVNIPMDSTTSLAIAGGITYYTSASNDRIDFSYFICFRKRV